MGSAVELDVVSSQARVTAAPASHDIRRAIKRFAIKQFLLAGLMLGGGLVAAWYAEHRWTVGRFIESTDGAYVGGELTVISPKVAGLIAEVAVTDNQAVHAGDLLGPRGSRPSPVSRSSGAV
jgi:membrane fusion protein (multidrug efflux system)